MGYYIDLAKISIDAYCLKLESAYLPPSRLMLKEKTAERLGYFKSIGISNIKELIQLLKKKDKFTELSKVACLSNEFLTLLLRELNSTLPKPNKIADFKGIAKETVQILETMGINNTEKLYQHVLTKKMRQKFADTSGIGNQELLELTKLTDLSRIKWVGATFARMLYDLGTDTAEKASKSDPVELHAQITNFNKSNDIYKGQIGLNDIRIFVQAANEIPLEIEY